MRKLLFALALMVMGAFAFAAGTPASAMTAAPVAGMSDVVKADGLTQVRHWRHRRHHYWRHHHRRHHYWRYNHRRCWWHRGHRHCRWGY